jgi:hypothetical protein
MPSGTVNKKETCWNILTAGKMVLVKRLFIMFVLLLSYGCGNRGGNDSLTVSGAGTSTTFSNSNSNNNTPFVGAGGSSFSYSFTNTGGANAAVLGNLFSTPNSQGSLRFLPDNTRATRAQASMATPSGTIQRTITVEIADATGIQNNEAFPARLQVNDPGASVRYTEVDGAVTRRWLSNSGNVIVVERTPERLVLLFENVGLLPETVGSNAATGTLLVTGGFNLIVSN